MNDKQVSQMQFLSRNEYRYLKMFLAENTIIIENLTHWYDPHKRCKTERSEYYYSERVKGQLRDMEACHKIKIKDVLYFVDTAVSENVAILAATAYHEGRTMKVVLD